MAIPETAIGGWGGFRDPFDKSRDVRELIDTAERCDMAINEDLFWKIVNTVYANPADSFAPAMTKMFEALAAAKGAESNRDDS